VQSGKLCQGFIQTPALGPCPEASVGEAAFKFVQLGLKESKVFGYLYFF